MLAHLDPDTCRTIAAGLLGGIDVDGGPTAEQRTVLDALARHSLGLTDDELTTLEPMGAATLAGRLSDPDVRRRFHHLHVALEACRHPQTPGQVRAVEEYADALGTPSADRTILRALVDEGAERAAADYRRYVADALPRRSEPGLATPDLDPDAPEPELTARLEQPVRDRLGPEPGQRVGPAGRPHVRDTVTRWHATGGWSPATRRSARS